MDLFTLFGPGNVAMRAAAIVGRVLAMAADYVPDHHIVQEELVFQVFMLGLAWIGLVKAALPLAFATLNHSMTYRDGKAFHRLFEPSGVTRHQFRALCAFCLDWIEVEPDQVIIDEHKNDDYIYWLYNGSVSVSRDEQVLYNVTSSKCAGLGLLGETRLLQQLSKKERKSAYPPTTATAGENGAALLRIHTNHLRLLMQSDSDLEDSMRELLLTSMHDKLAAHAD